MLHSLCKLFCSSETPSQVQKDLIEVASGRSPGLLSAACCLPNARQQDKALLDNFKEAASLSGLENLECKVISITDARKVLPTISDSLDPPGQRLVNQIQQLVAQEGFGIFPMLLVDGRIAYFGGIPSSEMILEKLESLRDMVS